MPLPPTVRCGPSGWAYPDWNGLVYPQNKPRGFHALSYLAGYFDLFEIETARKAALRPEVMRLWLKKAGPRPIFTVVLSSRITEQRDLTADTVREFKEGVWPLLEAGRLGCVVMEFPWSFRFTKENREFLIAVRRRFREFPLVAEMRHSSWMLDEALGTLMDYRIGFSNLDQPVSMRAMPATSIVTSGIGCVRLHGRSQDYLYTPFELSEWQARIERVAKHTDATYVIAANAAHGKSLVNAWQLKTMLGLSHDEAPPELVRHYPDQLVAICPPGRQRTETLRLCG